MWELLKIKNRNSFIYNILRFYFVVPLGLTESKLLICQPPLNIAKHQQIQCFTAFSPYLKSIQIG